MNTLSGDLDAAKRRLAEQDAGRVHLESALQEARARMGVLQEELERVRGMDIAQRAAEVERLRAEISELERQREALVGEREEEAARADAALAEKAERAMLALQAQLDGKLAELDEVMARVQAAQERLTQVQAEVVQGERRIVRTEETAMLQEVGVYAYRHPARGRRCLQGPTG
ncbi:hypothetical protein NGB36_18205 [Streptomyces sp. RB6PN25]|uniref:Uncharacterized protein n=1 Tax=Streptomyces humicola TaxID=2953240 RepID=A0ABT1PXU3_9ACTN|nr:hypothetical protein [Streptomyces humicola]MCQ4082482.1 hypothetical protein [Streptomyces humicola]